MSTDGSRIERDARVTWQGTLSDGSGQIADSAGAAQGTDLTWAGRTSAGPPATRGATSPEELIAAAHAGCYSMSLANVLERNGHRPERLDVQARCTAGLGEAGLGIEAIDLVVRGLIPGLDAVEFGRLADEAERLCPVSNSLRGNVDIRVDAGLLEAAA
jgi:osmotically inducible protein OsmC